MSPICLHHLASFLLQPLNGIIGLTEFILGTDLNPTQRNWVHSVRTSGRVLLALANHILDFARIEAHRLELTLSPFRTRKLVEEVVQVQSRY